MQKFTEIWKEIFVMEYILTNFMLYLVYVRGNFKNETIYIWQYIHILHWYSVCGAFQLCVKKSYIYVKNFNTWQLCGFFFTFLYSTIRIFRIFYGFYKHWCSNSFFNSLLTSFARQKLLNMYCNPCPSRGGEGVGFR